MDPGFYRLLSELGVEMREWRGVEDAVQQVCERLAFLMVQRGDASQHGIADGRIVWQLGHGVRLTPDMAEAAMRCALQRMNDLLNGEGRLDLYTSMDTVEGLCTKDI